MTKRHWKRTRPTSLRHAMELCLEHARSELNLSVDRVADRMGLANKWTLYKWLESGRMPAILIRPFEMACGINYLTQNLAASDHKLLIDIPAGRRVTENEINELQGSFARAMSELINFYNGKSDEATTLAAITGVMEQLAWHRGNLQKQSLPELTLFGESEDDT